MWPFSRKHLESLLESPTTPELAAEERMSNEAVEKASPETRTWQAGYFSLTLPLEYLLEHHHSGETENRNLRVDLDFSSPCHEPLPPVPELTVATKPGADPDPFAALIPDPPKAPSLRPSSFAPPAPRKRPMVQQDTWSWQGEGDRSIQLIVWSPEPPSDGGPMRAIAEWNAVLAGTEVHVSETALFFGLAQRVLVTHITLAAPRCICLLFAKGLDRQQFTAILESTELHGNQIESLTVKPPQPPAFGVK